MNKKNVSIFKIFVIALVLSITVSFLAAKSTFSEPQFDQYIGKALTDWNVPGIAVGVIQDGKVILAKGDGFRDVEKKLPVTPQTVFSIGSTTKAFTTFIMGTLVDEGKINFDKPVKTYLPDFKMVDPYVTEHLTIRDLLIHNSGLPRHDFSWYGSSRSTEELIKSLEYLEPSAGFRSTFQYQNIMYMTAGYIEGKVSGSTWKELVTKRIFEPLGMKNSNFNYQDSMKSLAYASPYDEEDGKIIKIPFYENTDNLAPAGAINSNIEDMLQWLKLNMQNGKWNDKALINAATLKEIQSSQMVIKGGSSAALADKFKEFAPISNYGMGWFIQVYRGHTILHHGGNINGFSAFITFMPDTQTGIVILINKDSSLLTYGASLFLYDQLLGVPPRQWSKDIKQFTDTIKAAAKQKKEKDSSCVENTKPSHPLQDYTGNFNNPGYGDLSVSLKDNSLIITYNNIPIPLKHCHYDVFTMEYKILKGMKCQFFSNDKGDIDKISLPFENGMNIVFERCADSEMTKPEFLKKFVGRFELEKVKMPITVTLRGDKTLVADIPGQPQYELVPYKKTTFMLKDFKGFSVEFTLDKDGNANEGIVHQPNGDFKMKRVADTEPVPQLPKDSKLLDPQFLKKFTGVYKFEKSGLELTITLQGEKTLIAQATGQPAAELVPVKDTTFSIKNLGSFSLEFTLDKNGKVTGGISHQPNGDFPIKRISDK